MVDIGVLGLDTSHPESFADILRGREDATLAAVWDGGDVRSDEYVEKFCRTHEATRHEEPAAMVEAVDVAMVLTVNWETHLPLARPFLEAGVPTLVDKPLGGNLEAVDGVERAAENAPLFGGSAVPFHPDFLSLPNDATDRTLFAAGYNDYFYYRVHLADTVRRIVGAEWSRVEPTDDFGTTVRATFADGTATVLRFDGSSDGGAFGVLDVADQTRAVEIPGTKEALDRMYEGYLDAFLDVARGERDDTDLLVDAARLALAVEAVLNRDEAVTPDSEALAAVERDGGEFLADYSPYY